MHHRPHTEWARVRARRKAVQRLLHNYFRINNKLLRVKSLTIPAKALAIVHEAMRARMLSAVEDLRVCLPDIDDVWERLCMAHDLLRRTDSDDDVDVYLGRKFGAVLADALYNQLATERGLADTTDKQQRERHPRMRLRSSDCSPRSSNERRKTAPGAVESRDGVSLQPARPSARRMRSATARVTAAMTNRRRSRRACLISPASTS